MKEERLIRIYVSYPYSDNPKKRNNQIKTIVKKIMEHGNGFVLFVPHFAFHFFNRLFGVERADEHCLELLKVSDALCICLPKNEPLTRGMKTELDYARAHHMPIIYVDDFLKDTKGTLKILKEKQELEQAVASTR
jgi:hypothetical protein